LGDDTILQSLVPELQNQGWEPRVLGGDPGLAEKLGIVVYPWSPWQQAVRAVADCDAVILGGGGLFQDYWGADVATLFGQHHSLTYYCGVAQTARMFHIPYAILGVGVGPVSTPLGRELVLDTFRHASYASVRDTGSQQTLQLLGLALHQIHPGADLAALTISRLQRGEREKRACNLVVNLRPWPFWPDQVRALELLARELAALARQENLKVLLLAMTRGEDPHHSDEAFLREFAGRLQQNGVEDPSLVVPASPREAAACLAPARLAVVMRYHAAMLAGALAVPFVALVYDPKVRFLLEELGCPEAGIPLAFTPGELANRLRTAPSSLAASGEKFSQLTQRAREDLTRALHALTQALGTNQRLSPLAQAALERVASEAAQLPQLQQEVAFREAEREALARKAARLAEELEETRQREAKLVEAYAERQAAVERLTHQLTELTAQLTAAEQRSAELAAGLSERQAEVERLSAKLEEAGAAYQELQQRYEHVLQAHGERQQEVERLSRELADRMADLQRFHTTLADLTSTKWFKLASRYWKLRDRLRRKRNSTEQPVGVGAPSSPNPRPSRECRPETGQQPRVAAGPSAAPTALAEDEAWLQEVVDSPHFDILVLPIIEWDFRFQRPQQLASHLAHRGHRVFYASHAFGGVLAVRPKGTRVWEVQLAGSPLNVYRERLDPQTCRQLLTSVDQLRRDFLLGATAVVVQLPFWWPLAEALRRQFGWPVIYDCMDYHAGFTTNEPEMLAQEEALLAGADLVVVSSRMLETIARQHNPRVVLIPNACDYPHFAQVPARPPGSPPTVGYFGAIADWFDADLVADLAELKRHWKFLLVGSTFTGDTRRLKRLPNVELVGEKPYRELPLWIAQMDACIIPFKRLPLTQATNPVKFYEIMAAGKPLVSVPLPELEPYGELVAFAQTPGEFAAQLEAVLSNWDEGAVSRRRAFAQDQTWAQRAEAFALAVVECFPKASVVIVTYNNLPLTQQCLDSLWRRTEWPHWEVFVVDNASSDGTPSYLGSLAQKHKNLQVILLDENRGFPAANNLALRHATGEYLVLLNNDTVVTRGWLSKLILHLHQHPEWGLVGPVTNWIGNEAQVPVGYQTLIEMPWWAARHVRRQDGRWFSIPMLAMFCVAMRAEVFRRVGELDEQFGLGMFEDDDYARRVRAAGLEVVCVEDVFVHHHGKAAFSKLPAAQYEKLFAENRRRFEAKWNTAWQPHQYRKN
ncbi:MAG: glycosyltransferase, partial [Thermoanaerobaculum sp.]|nr:glycosyltransferase [Thermoanaerobaculum sp.]